MRSIVQFTGTSLVPNSSILGTQVAANVENQSIIDYAYGGWFNVRTFGTGQIARTGIAVFGNIYTGSTMTEGCGVRGENDFAGTTRYGVFGRTGQVGLPVTSFQAGVYGTAPANGTLSPLANGTWVNNSSWAVYSNGAQFSTTNALWGTSDARLKKNIRPLENALTTILSLEPKTYTYDLDAHPTYNLPVGEQIGLIAQDVQKVLPTVVVDTHYPDQFDDKGQLIDSGFELKALNYIGLIPVLIGGVKEQQATIEAQRSMIAELERRIEALEESRSGARPSPLKGDKQASIEQNSPNPFNENTVIKYSLPGTEKGVIHVHDARGTRIQSFAVNGVGQLLLSAGSLGVGSYTYTLEVNGAKVDSKTMVITP